MRIAKTAALAALLLAAALQGGCAYYNTFYNARTAFSEAEALGKDTDPREWPTAAQRPKYQASIAKCQLLLEEFPDSKYVDDALFLMGKAQFRLKDYRRAIRNFDNVLTNWPRSQFAEEALYLKSIAHLELGEEQVSLDTLHRLRESYPDSRYAQAALYRLGDTFAAEERWEQALNYYEEFLANYPDNPERSRVLYDTGRIYRELGRYEEAAEVLGELEKDRDKANLKRIVEAKLLRAESLIELDRSEEAAELLDEVSEDAAVIGQRGHALILEGRVALSQGREDEGMAILEQATNEFPKTAVETEARYVMARHLLQAEGPQEGAIRDELQTALDSGLKGDFAEPARKLLGRMQRYQGLARALEEPDSTSWRQTFDMAELLYLDLERPDLALPWYRKVVEDYPESPVAPKAAYAVGFIEREDEDDEDAAQEAFALLEERYPESPQARALQGELFLEARPPGTGPADQLRPAPRPEGGVSPPPPAVGPPPAGDRPALDARRALRAGGPGARTPRRWGRS